MKGRKIVSLLLVLILLMTALPVRIFAKGKVGVGAPILQELETHETTSGAIQLELSKYVGDGYEVEFKVVSQWGGKFDGEIILTNTDDKTIESWALKFDFKHTINSIWNAELISSEDGYTFKNLGWNKDIKPGASVRIGFGASWDDQIVAPKKYDLVTSKQNVSSEDYTIDFKIASDWGQGFNGEISIINNTEEVIEDWVLEFDFDRDIQSFWTAKIAEHTEDHYIIKNAVYNANIKPNETVKLGFSGNVDSEPENYILKQVGKEIDYEKDSDEDDLPDWFEKEIGTNPHKADTDGDRLPDGYEYFVLDTDPLEQDTDNNGILDGDEDFDGDRLTNIEEYKLETDPNNEDTDEDYLSDGDEVNKFGTDPLTYNEIDVSLDSDGDGLLDGVEMIIGTDPFNQDTDGDGLSDSYEHLTLGTDPLLWDTNNDGINDAIEDLDTDGLNNLEEYVLGTNPLDDDSDDDNLLDGDEVNIYGTDPLVFDTDGDGLIDSDDILLGFNPLLKDTDGNGVIDSKEETNQTITEEIKGTQKLEVVSVSVDLKCKGNIKDAVTITNVYNIDISSSEVIGLIGVPVEISSEVDFEKATIKFKYDEKLLGQTEEADLAVMWYDEANDRYAIYDQDTIVDVENDTVSYATTHFSTYLLVDRKQWYEAWKYDIDYTRTDETTLFYDIGLVIDTSGSMGGTPIANVKTGLVDFIDAMYEGDNACLINFHSYAYLIKPFNSKKEDLKNGIKSLYASGGTDTNAGLKLGISQLVAHNSSNEKIIIMICDGDVNYVQSTVDSAKKNNIKVYTVNIAYAPSHTKLEKIGSETGGEYYFATNATALLEVLMQIQSQTIEGIDTTDTDSDGLYDIFETKGMRLSNGAIIRSNPLLADTDGDGLVDSEEIVYLREVESIPDKQYMMSYVNASNGTNNYKASFQYKSDLNKIDTDGDGIVDASERNVAERRRYNETLIKDGYKLRRNIVNPGDVHTFIFEPPYNGVNKIYTEGSTDTYMKVYYIPSYKNPKETLRYTDDNSGDNKNAKIVESFFPTTSMWTNEVVGGYKIKVTHALPKGMGAYDILLKQTGVYEEAGFKDGDYTLLYAINKKRAYPFLVQLKENNHG